MLTSQSDFTGKTVLFGLPRRHRHLLPRDGRRPRVTRSRIPCLAARQLVPSPRRLALGG
jgi:hypothetical protein